MWCMVRKDFTFATQLGLVLSARRGRFAIVEDKSSVALAEEAPARELSPAVLG